MKSEVLEKFIEYNKQLRISKKGNCENKIKLDNLNEIQLKYK